MDFMKIRSETLFFWIIYIYSWQQKQRELRMDPWSILNEVRGLCQSFALIIYDLLSGLPSSWLMADMASSCRSCWRRSCNISYIPSGISYGLLSMSSAYVSELLSWYHWSTPHRYYRRLKTCTTWDVESVQYIMGSYHNLSSSRMSTLNNTQHPGSSWWINVHLNLHYLISPIHD